MKFLISSSLFLIVFLFSCGNDASVTTDENIKTDTLNTVVMDEPNIIEPLVDEEVVTMSKDGITLTEIKSENNKEAAIDLNTKQFNEGKNKLQFGVTGVEDYTISYLANNYSLTRFSSDMFEVEYLYGNNVFLAFLTDKNGISIKTNKGCILKNVVLGAGMESLFDMNQPHLFYYLPQKETADPILDFYLVNTSISAEGNKVKVVINGLEFIINKWAAYQISGLTKSVNTIRIQLIDKKGDLIEGPFNDSGDRVFNLVNKSA